MPEVVYRSEVRIERVKGPVRRAHLPAESQPVTFGVHGAVAEHYKVAARTRRLRKPFPCKSTGRPLWRRALVAEAESCALPVCGC
jgi:hypothetical protein